MQFPCNTFSQICMFWSIFLLRFIYLSYLISFYSEASIRDSVTVKEESKKLSIPQIKKMLNKAHLENHGYRKKVTQETSKDSRGRLIYSKTTSFTYNHRVPCPKAQQVVEETKSLLLKNTKDAIGNFDYQNYVQTAFQIMHWFRHLLQ